MSAKAMTSPPTKLKGCPMPGPYLMRCEKRAGHSGKHRGRTPTLMAWWDYIKPAKTWNRRASDA